MNVAQAHAHVGSITNTMILSGDLSLRLHFPSTFSLPHARSLYVCHPGKGIFELFRSQILLELKEVPAGIVQFLINFMFLSYPVKKCETTLN